MWPDPHLSCVSLTLELLHWLEQSLSWLIYEGKLGAGSRHCGSLWNIFPLSGNRDNGLNHEEQRQKWLGWSSGPSTNIGSWLKLRPLCLDVEWSRTLAQAIYPKQLGGSLVQEKYFEKITHAPNTVLIRLLDKVLDTFVLVLAVLPLYS